MNRVFTHSYRVLATSNNIPQKSRFGQVIIHYFTKNTLFITIKRRQGECCQLKIGTLQTSSLGFGLVMAPPLGWDLMWHWPSAKGKSLTGLIWVDGTEVYLLRPPKSASGVTKILWETFKKIHLAFC